MPGERVPTDGRFTTFTKEVAMPKRTVQKEDTPRMKRIIFGKGASASRGPSQVEIERRAYQIFLERGCTDGHADEDWLQAEYELRREKGQA
jgi:hypothetical protein